MAVTRLERKARKNVSRAKNKMRVIKQLTFQPVIKQVDVEAMREEFAKKGGNKPAETTVKSLVETDAESLKKEEQAEESQASENNEGREG